jgi:hypothetical protein
MLNFRGSVLYKQDFSPAGRVPGSRSDRVDVGVGGSQIRIGHRLHLHSTMSGQGARESPFPTRMALTNTKLRLKGAQTGHSLLAKKRDALTTRFRAILKKVDEVRAYTPSHRLS